MAAAIGAVVLYRYYAIFEHDTDSASGAREAYLMCTFIAGGVGLGIALLVFWLLKLIGLRR